jgi:acyl carrier protein
MEKNEIIKKAQAIVRQVLKNDSFEWKEELTAEEIDRWDSLSHMIIITELENEFRIKFKLKELNKLNNLDSLITLIQSKL